MPQLEAPDQLSVVNLEYAEYLKATQTPEDARALQLVMQTFTRYEQQRQSREMKWREADRLYHAQVEPRKWEGTDKARASLAVPLVFDQIEAVHPHIVTALFGQLPYWFGVEPVKGVKPDAARRFQSILGAYLESPYDETGLTAPTNLAMAVRQAQKYGDGAIEISWDSTLERPVVEWLDIRDLYFDLTIKGPVVDWSPSVIIRKMISVEDLIEMRESEGVDIPSDEILAYLASSRMVRVADATKTQQATARQERINLFETRVDPIQRDIEVLAYWSKTKLIWVLGGQYVSINTKNPFGFIPVCKAPFIPVEGQPWGFSQAEGLRDDQKYATGIRNLRLDNLNLALNPPRHRQRGADSSPAKLAWRPGLIDEVGKPGDVEVQKIENYTPQALAEEQIIHSMAQKRFGVNDMMASGVPTPSNANRTGVGVAAQGRATNMRLSTAVKAFEDYLIVPMLYKLQRMLQRFAPEVIEMGPVVEPKDALDVQVKFIMRGASKMVTRENLAGALVPITQTIFSDVVMNQARLQGQTLDFAAFSDFLQDATGTTEAYSFFRDMNEQETAMSQQPDPNTMAKMQAAQAQSQATLESAKIKAGADVEKAKMAGETRSHQTAEESARELVKVMSQLLGHGQGSGLMPEAEEPEEGAE